MDTATPHQTTPEPDGPSSGPAEEAIGSSDHLVRLRRGRMLAGVAAGLADWFDVDPTLVRVAFVALALLGGVAVPIYLAAWLLIPEEGTEVSVAEELLARERVR
jgi:phage shock protein PspC (stress-responsive transcriptional regulator)